MLVPRTLNDERGERNFERTLMEQEGRMRPGRYGTSEPAEGAQSTKKRKPFLKIPIRKRQCRVKSVIGRAWLCESKPAVTVMRKVITVLGLGSFAFVFSAVSFRLLTHVPVCLSRLDIE